MADALWVMLGIGGLLGSFMGFRIGRWSAENRRARYDMGRVWGSRQTYRNND